MILLIVIGWFVCAVLTAGVELADAQGKYPRFAEAHYRDDLGSSWFIGLFFGPLALILSVFMTGFYQHGFMNPFKFKRD